MHHLFRSLNMPSQSLHERFPIFFLSVLDLSSSARPFVRRLRPRARALPPPMRSNMGHTGEGPSKLRDLRTKCHSKSGTIFIKWNYRLEAIASRLNRSTHELILLILCGQGTGLCTCIILHFPCLSRCLYLLFFSFCCLVSALPGAEWAPNIIVLLSAIWYKQLSINIF